MRLTRCLIPRRLGDMNPLSRFLRWLDRPIETTFSAPWQETLNRCATDPRFRALDDPHYGQRRLFVLFGPWTFA